MPSIPIVGLLLLAQPAPPASDAPSAGLLEEMVRAVAQVDCDHINQVWRKASKARVDASVEFQTALDNLHARRRQLRCLRGCEAGEYCPEVKRFSVRYADYGKMHERLTKCLEVGDCEEETIDELQGALRASARVLLAELKPNDPRWTELVSSFTTIVGFDTSAGSLLTMVSHLSLAQRRAIDWKQLSRAVGALIDIIPPDELEAEDARRVLRFASAMLKSSERVHPEDLEQLGKEWHLILGILDKLRTPAMRQAADRMLDVLIKRYAGKDTAKSQRYRDIRSDLKASSSLDTVAKVVRGLDIAELEEIQRAAERMVLVPAILAEYRAKRLYTTLDLPPDCPVKARVKSEHCDAIYAVADQFSLILDGRALAGTSKTDPENLDVWLDNLEKDLVGGEHAPRLFRGQFAGGVGLQIRPVQPGGTMMSIRAEFVVETLDNGPAERHDVRCDRGRETRTVDPSQTSDVGKDLAEAVLERSTLLKAFDRTYYNAPPAPTSEPPKPRLPPPHPAWALVSAGLPLFDGTARNRWLGIGLSAADTLALVSASVFFVQAKSERDAFAAGSSGNMSAADRKYELALNMLVVSGICKALGALGSLWLADGGRP